MVRRFARLEPVLAAELENLNDGYDVVQGAVRDLVDAGFEPEHEDGVLERSRRSRPCGSPIKSGSCRRADSGDREGPGEPLRSPTPIPSAARYTRAAEALREHGARIASVTGVLVHGFADLTGVASDLLTTVLRELGGVVLVDRVPDPSRPEHDDSGNAFLDRLDSTLGGLEREEDGEAPSPPKMDFAEAPDVEAEARWVAETVRSIVERRDRTRRHRGGGAPARWSSGRR